jgi:uncharacterized membrane protein
MTLIAGLAHDAKALLDLAIHRAPVTRNAVAVVTLLALFDLTVATNWNLAAQLAYDLFGSRLRCRRTVAYLAVGIAAPTPQAAILSPAAGVATAR